MRKAIVLFAVLLAGIAQAGWFDQHVMDENGASQAVNGRTVNGKVILMDSGATFTNTYYIQSVTRSVTGAWINCDGVKKVIFQIKLANDLDTNTPVDSASYFIESDCRAASSLSTSILPWVTNLNGIKVTTSGYVGSVDYPCSAIRFRLQGDIRYTGSIYYKLVY